MTSFLKMSSVANPELQTFSTGKHKGLTVKQVSLRDPEYVCWAYASMKNGPIITREQFEDAYKNVMSRKGHDRSEVVPPTEEEMQEWKKKDADWGD